MQRDNVTASFYFNLSGVTSSNQISKSTSFVTFSIHIVTFSGEIGKKGELAKKAVVKFNVSRKPPADPRDGIGSLIKDIKLYRFYLK